MKGNMIAVIMAILALALAVISLFLLPDIVTVQIGADGQPSNTMPKELATLLFTMISLAGTVLTLKGKGSDGKKRIPSLRCGHCTHDNNPCIQPVKKNPPADSRKGSVSVFPAFTRCVLPSA